MKSSRRMKRLAVEPVEDEHPPELLQVHGLLYGAQVYDFTVEKVLMDGQRVRIPNAVRDVAAALLAVELFVLEALR